MKHAFALIDGITAILAKIPRDLSTKKQVKKATNQTTTLHLLIDSLADIIEAHTLEEHLVKLKQCPVPAIVDWEARVERLFTKLIRLMTTLDIDIKAMWVVLDQARSEGFPPPDERASKGRWETAAGDILSGAIQAGFIHEEQEMNEFRNMAVLEEHHLKEIFNDPEEMSRILQDLIPIEDVLD